MKSLSLDDAFRERARRRHASAWARFVSRADAAEDDPDDAAASPQERLALVDTLSLIALFVVNALGNVLLPNRLRTGIRLSQERQLRSPTDLQRCIDVRMGT